MFARFARKNRFPKALIDRIIKSFLDKKFEAKVREKVPENEKDIVIFCMPYLGNYSLQVKTKLSKLIKCSYPNIDFKVIFRCPRRIMSYFPFKDRLSTLLCSGVVYKFECPDCNARYYGRENFSSFGHTLQRAFRNKQGWQKDQSESLSDF